MRQFIIGLSFGICVLFSMLTNAGSKLTPPSELCQPHKKIFAKYLAAPNHKAFSVSSDGSYGWSSGRGTVEEAKKDALAFCQKHANKSCWIYSAE